jgi:hypothetical protein
MLILLPRVSKASSKWLLVPAWLACAFLLAAFLDQSPDPPAIKPGLIAAASISNGAADLSQLDWDGPVYLSAPISAVRWIDFHNFIDADGFPFHRVLAKAAADSSPPNAI